MISTSNTRVGIVVVDGVEYYTDTFVIGTFRKVFNDEATRLDHKNCEKRLRSAINTAYQFAKEVAVEVPKHCPAFLRVSSSKREALCKECAWKVREAETKLNNSAVKAGFKLSGTALYRILKYQASFERKSSSKRVAETGEEEATNTEVEGTPRKVTKSQSSISVCENLEEQETDESDENFEVFDDTLDLSLNIPDQTTVIEVVKPEPVTQASTIQTYSDNPSDCNFESRENHEERERKLPAAKYILTKTWRDYLREVNRFYSDEVTKNGTYISEYNLHYDSDQFLYHRGKRCEYTDTVTEFSCVGPVNPTHYVEWLSYRRNNPEHLDLEITANVERIAKEREVKESLDRFKAAETNSTKDRARSRSPHKQRRVIMTKTESTEINPLKDIKIDAIEVKDDDSKAVTIDSLGEIIRKIGGEKSNSYDEKVKAFENLTTGAPLNGREKWDIVLKDMKEACIERTSVLVEPTFYFELKFLLQLSTTVNFNSSTDKTVLAIKSRLKLLMLAYKMGWKAVYEHFDIDHKTQGETKKTIEDVYGEELDSDIEIINYKGPNKTNRPYEYGYRKPTNNKKPYRRDVHTERFSKANDDCYNCGKRGHYASECRSRPVAPPPPPRSSEQCYACAKYGHYAAQCQSRRNQYKPQYQPQRQHQQRRPPPDMACYGCGKTGHLIADCYTTKNQRSQPKNTYKSKKGNSKKQSSSYKNNKYEKRRQFESDHYDSGDESEASVHNRSMHNPPPPQQVELPIQYPVQQQWQQQQQVQLQNPFIQAPNHQRPFFPQQSGYYQ